MILRLYLNVSGLRLWHCVQAVSLSELK